MVDADETAFEEHHPLGIEGGAISIDGRLFVAVPRARDECVATIWCTVTGRLRHVLWHDALEMPHTRTRSVDVRRTRVVTGDESGTVAVWDLENATLLNRFGLREPILALRLTADESQVVIVTIAAIVALDTTTLTATTNRVEHSPLARAAVVRSSTSSFGLGVVDFCVTRDGALAALLVNGTIEVCDLRHAKTWERDHARLFAIEFMANEERDDHMLFLMRLDHTITSHVVSRDENGPSLLGYSDVSVIIDGVGVPRYPEDRRIAISRNCRYFAERCYNPEGHFQGNSAWFIAIAPFVNPTRAVRKNATNWVLDDCAHMTLCALNDRGTVMVTGVRHVPMANYRAPTFHRRFDRAERVTLALVGGVAAATDEPRTRAREALWRFLNLDGDHACWSRVMRFV